MKRLIVVLSLVVSVSTFFALAQEKSEKKIRLKIEKIINGEKVIIDTTFKKFDGKTIKKFIGDDNLMEITINASDDCKSFKSESNTFYYTVDDDGKDEKKVFISCDKSGNHTIDIKEEEGEDGVIIKKVYIKSDCSDDAVNVSESKCYVYATGDSKSEKAHVIEMRKFIGDDNNDIESVNVTNTSETQAITIQKKDGESKTFDIHIDSDDKIVIYDDNGTVKGCNKNIKIIKSEDGDVEQITVTLNIDDIDNVDIKELKKTGIKKANSKNSLKPESFNLFPNPSKGEFRLKFSLEETSDVLINIFDIEGKTVYTEKLKSFNGEYDESLNLLDEKKGTYYLQILQDGKALNKKLIIN